MNLLALGAGMIGLMCGGSLVYIFGLGPLSYIISAAVHKVEGRNYLKALAVFGISIVASGIVHFILSRVLSSKFLVWLLAIVINAVVGVLLVWLFYHVGFGKAVTVWLLAFAINLGIALLIGLFGLIFASTAAVGTIRELIQQYSFVFGLV
jgi:hypothetical protein